ncbi:MAG: hypothetical protein K1X83_01785 [Oligoflexia bacterium]|nr:hypothetical protein [Oligoflexia bacterium]
MRIAALESFLTELVCHFGLQDHLVGVSADSDFPEAISALPRVTAAESGSGMINGLASAAVDPASIKNVGADILLGGIPGKDEDGTRLKRAREVVRSTFGEGVKFSSYWPRTLEQVSECFEKVGRELGAADRGVALSHNFKAQAMDWCDNFYERMKNKRVSFISALEPLSLARGWVPDMIHMCSAHSHSQSGGEVDEHTDWESLKRFRPDVMIFGLRGVDLHGSAQSLKRLERLDGWDDIPAVKRGEVVFVEGRGHFHRPGPRLLDSMGILVSAIAGLDSGYITPRESFYRLRWVELQRHRFS